MLISLFKLTSSSSSGNSVSLLSSKDLVLNHFVSISSSYSLDISNTRPLIKIENTLKIDFNNSN